VSPATRFSNGVIAMLLFVFVEALLYAGLISAHATFLSDQVGQIWPPLDQPRLPLAETAVNTAVLLASGCALVATRFGFRSELRKTIIPLAVAILLGGFFVTFQGVAWAALLQEGLTIRSSAYGSFFYLIVGTHTVQAAAALACLVWAWVRLRRTRLSASQFLIVEIYWYFLVLVWPVIYIQVYQ
jgi:cytochrome c oxidase subunit 3